MNGSTSKLTVQESGTGARTRSRLGPALYALLFCLVVPAGLVAWAFLLEPRVPLRKIHQPWLGWALVAMGLAGMGWSTWTLRRQAGGWPMNAFPPPRLATGGPYAFVRDPIYLSFVLALTGLFLAIGSAAGLWAVLPIVALGCAALVFGYERHDLHRRFPHHPHRPWLSLPPDSSERPRWSESLAAVVLVFLPWFLLYEATVILGPAPDGFSGAHPWEARWPVIQWTESIYLLAYPFAALAPLAIDSQSRLRRYVLRGWLATGTGILLFHLIPILAPPRPFVPEGFWGQLLALERLADPSPGCAFPSFHTLWAMMAALEYGRHNRTWAVMAWTMALAIAASCITTGMHVVIDLLGSILVFWMVVRSPQCWELLRRLSETVANSWQHWMVGPVRIINHGAYAAVGSCLGLALMMGAGGARPALAGAILTLALGSLLCAALWAQLIEGSPRLLRPFGYYGCILGGLLLAPVVSWVWSVPLMLLLGCFGLAAPWIQAFGRFRCMVQGCCHGGPAPEWLGIRYHHERSRVCLFTPWAGQPLHPTQLYSVLGNVLIGAVLLRLWVLDAAPALIGGLYLLLSSFLRFVEESFRQEPQTRIWAGLAIYQWLCLLCVVVGIMATIAPGPETWPPAGFSPRVLVGSFGFGFVVWFCMSVDFPQSQRRFARLTG